MTTLNDRADTLKSIQGQLRRFAARRDWDRFHSPKNLCMALAAEVGELTEHFQWLTEEASTNLLPGSRTRVAEEVADILIYLVRLADKLNIDVAQAVKRKIRINAIKYPVARAKGSSRKYSDSE